MRLRVVAEPASNGSSIEPRHVYVEQQDVVGRGAAGLQRLVAVRGHVGSVAEALTVGAAEPLSFGTLAPGSAVSVAADAGQGTAGLLPFGYNTNYQIELTTVTDFTNGTVTIPVTWDCGTSDAVATPATSILAGCTAGDVIISDSGVTAAGTTVVWLGGSLTVPSDAMAGNYQADLTFTISSI